MTGAKIITIVCMVLFFGILVSMHKQPASLQEQTPPHQVMQNETRTEVSETPKVSHQLKEKKHSESGFNFFSALGQLLALTLSGITSFIAETVSYVLS